MAQQNYPYVLIAPDAWQQIAQEIQYWADQGIQRGHGPIEAVFYPLSAITLRASAKCTPFNPIDLSDIEYFTICQVFIPPRVFANYSTTSAEFRDPKGNNAYMQQFFTSQISNINKRYPQLLFLGPGHSHPFAVGSTAPSGTDINYHIQPYRLKNEELLGLRFSLALIVVQAPKGGWQACCFAMDETGQMHNLGIAEIGDKYDHRIRLARSRPYYRTRQGKRWEARQLISLQGRLMQCDYWVGGWSTFLYRLDDHNARLVILPPRFPTLPPLVQTITLSDRQAGELLIWRRGLAYDDYQLGDVDYDSFPQES